MTYAIIRLGGKQYRVQEGERLLVDRLRDAEGATFTPDLLFAPGDGTGVTVTARVVGHVKGEKLRIGKYRKRTGYKRHNGFRASLTQIEIQSIGAGGKKAAAKKAAEAPKPVDVQPKAAENLAALPEGYEEMKVADVTAGAKGWDRPLLEAALAYEQGHAARKGAVAALEAALAKLDEEEVEGGA